MRKFKIAAIVFIVVTLLVEIYEGFYGLIPIDLVGLYFILKMEEDPSPQEEVINKVPFSENPEKGTYPARTLKVAYSLPSGAKIDEEAIRLRLIYAMEDSLKDFMDIRCEPDYLRGENVYIGEIRILEDKKWNRLFPPMQGQ